MQKAIQKAKCKYLLKLNSYLRSFTVALRLDLLKKPKNEREKESKNNNPFGIFVFLRASQTLDILIAFIHFAIYRIRKSLLFSLASRREGSEAPLSLSD